jgi:transcriptional regulator with XRE-family HTH domain
MARAALTWSLDELAAATALNRKTILRLEQGHPLHRRNLQTIRRAFEAAGLRFIDEGEFAGGVAPTQPSEEEG